MVTTKQVTPKDKTLLKSTELAEEISRYKGKFRVLSDRIIAYLTEMEMFLRKEA
jgi:hypothetical protein